MLSNTEMNSVEAFNRQRCVSGSYEDLRQPLLANIETLRNALKLSGSVELLRYIYH